jgi:hypothetical protein
LRFEIGARSEEDIPSQTGAAIWEYYSPIDQKSDESKLDQQNPTRNYPIVEVRFPAKRLTDIIFSPRRIDLK